MVTIYYPVSYSFDGNLLRYVFLVSCSEDESANLLSHTVDSEWCYKDKLEKMLHLQLLDLQTEIDSSNHLIFNSYKELYENFKLLDGSEMIERVTKTG